MVPLVGLEPTHLAVPDFESGASTNFTTGARAAPIIAKFAWRSMAEIFHENSPLPL